MSVTNEEGGRKSLWMKVPNLKHVLDYPFLLETQDFEKTQKKYGA